MQAAVLENLLPGVVHWNREGERGSGAGVQFGPKASAVALDDGAADGQSYPHAVALGRLERLKQSF